VMSWVLHRQVENLQLGAPRQTRPIRVYRQDAISRGWNAVGNPDMGTPDMCCSNTAQYLSGTNICAGTGWRM
jgi:hypothetical protein